MQLNRYIASMYSYVYSVASYMHVPAGSRILIANINSGSGLKNSS